MLHKSC